jgi:hypothetical protein
MGGVATYLLARQQFVSERIWEKKYEVYSELFSLLNSLEHSLRVLEAAVLGGEKTRSADKARNSAKDFETDLLKLNQVQERLMLLGTDEARTKVMLLYVFLRVFDPGVVVSSRPIEEQALTEQLEVIKQSRREAAGRNGELAFLARRDLGLETAWGAGTGEMETSTCRQTAEERRGTSSNSE